VADQVLVFWSLNFNWAPICIRTYLTICLINYELCKIGLVLYLPERNCSISRGVPACCLAQDHVYDALVLVVNDPVSRNRKCALLNTTVFGWQFL